MTQYERALLKGIACTLAGMAKILCFYLIHKKEPAMAKIAILQLRGEQLETLIREMEDLGY